ncbi:hypothetical protein X989_3613 [Burkholderia pseudomallei MSHR4378]|nr:hypothetical protein X989_3613 [Burkholderia pseudomallei MSHR4378]
MNPTFVSRRIFGGGCNTLLEVVRSGDVATLLVVKHGRRETERTDKLRERLRSTTLEQLVDAPLAQFATPQSRHRRLQIRRRIVSQRRMFHFLSIVLDERSEEAFRPEIWRNLVDLVDDRLRNTCFLRGEILVSSATSIGDGSSPGLVGKLRACCEKRLMSVVPERSATITRELELRSISALFGSLKLTNCRVHKLREEET